MREGPESAETPQQPPQSNDQILAAFAHRRLSIERVRLIQEARNLRAKNPAQADITLQRANALKVAMKFFNHLQKPKKAGAQ